jgi:hypothetical protein
MLSVVLPAQTVRVIFVSGQASLQRPDETALRPAVKGDTVIIGTRIVTGADGRVVLTPMPGVKSIITPNTTVLLESASETRTSDTEVAHQAVLDLKQGAVVSDLKKPEGVTYDYNIRTARGIAGARGTTFTVGINAAGIQTIVVAHGSISINFIDGRTAVLSPGQLAITQATGESQSVNTIGELSEADQKIAQNWMETTISALATALEAGIEVDPTALQNALDTAKSLGFTLSDELQTLVDRVLAQLTVQKTFDPQTDIKTIAEVVSENQSEEHSLGGFESIDAFKASLTPDQLTAFENILSVGGFTSLPAFTEFTALTTTDSGPTPLELLTAQLKNAVFVKGLVGFIDFYSNLPSEAPERYVLTELGILGNGNLAVFGADIEGLANLLAAYAYMDASAPSFLYESDFAKTPSPRGAVQGDNFFFPGNGSNNGATIYNVTFDTQGNYALTVGATRKLIIDNTGYEGVAFEAGYFYEEGEYSAHYGRVELRASDLVSLNNTRFGSNVTSVLIEAATINLSNITFNTGMSVDLNSKFGSANFGSSKFGYVNLINNVKYGETVLTNANFGDDVRGKSGDATNGNVRINTIGQSHQPPR